MLDEALATAIVARSEGPGAGTYIGELGASIATHHRWGNKARGGREGVCCLPWSFFGGGRTAVCV